MELSLTQATSLLQKHIEKQKLKIENNEVLNYFNHKIRHTYAVLFDTQRILTYEKDIFNTDIIRKKVEIASLLHDIGRLYQNNGKRVLSNNEFEHGDAGYNILKNEGIKDLSILLSVKYHNKKDLDDLYIDKEYLSCGEAKQKEIELVSKIVRDADKLQNLEYIMFSDKNNLFLGNKDSNKIKQEVLDEFFKSNLINNNITESPAEKMLGLSAWVFDLNFLTTKKFLKQTFFVNFIEKKLVGMGINNDIIKKIIIKLREYI